MIEIPPKIRTVPLFGRFWAFISILPFLILAVVAFFAVAFIAVLLLVQSSEEAFHIVLLPFLMSMALAIPFLSLFVFMIHWHGKRRIDIDPDGLTLVLPGERKVYVPWGFLLAVELRFHKPRMVTCTLISGAIRFSFTSLELNLDRRVTLARVFKEGFEMDKMREFLYDLHRKNSSLAWRMTPEFKDQFKVFYPPYDLEKLK